jgi:hypothetical protein
MNAYIIVNSTHFFELPEIVNSYVITGYRPVGAPFVNLDGKLSQAMFKEPKTISSKKGETK